MSFTSLQTTVKFEYVLFNGFFKTDLPDRYL